MQTHKLFFIIFYSLFIFVLPLKATNCFERCRNEGVEIPSCGRICNDSTTLVGMPCYKDCRDKGKSHKECRSEKSCRGIDSIKDLADECLKRCSDSSKMLDLEEDEIPNCKLECK